MTKEVPVVFFDMHDVPMKVRIVNCWRLMTTGSLRIILPAANAKQILEDLRRKDLIMTGKTEL